MQPDNNKLIDGFVNYLVQCRLSEQSIKGYKAILKKYLLENPNGSRATYSDIISYLEGLHKFTTSKVTKQSKLVVLKKFFDFMIENDMRDDHPCKTIFVKTSAKRNVIQADLFSMAELESLMERDEKYKRLKQKNQVVISLLINQGITVGEMMNIKLHHVDLDSGSVYVNAGRLLTARRLPLLDKQVELIMDYLKNHRTKLLKNKKHDFLILNSNGDPENVDGLNYFISTFKDRFSDRNLNSKSIRDSVISYWINVKRIPPEQVQLLAGHRWISSTLRYKKDPVDKEREVLNRFFPI